MTNGTFRVTVKSTALNGSNVAYCGWVVIAFLNGKDGLCLDIGESMPRLQNGGGNSTVFGFKSTPRDGSTYDSYSFGTQALEVYGPYIPPVISKGFNVKLMGGATFDLSSFSGAYSCAFVNAAGTKGGATDCRIAFASNATITVNLAGRTDLDSIANARGYVATWAATAVPADSVTFLLDEVTAANSQEYYLRKDATGLKLCKKDAFTIVIR